jgi:Trk-type K+ transport system membrane component
MKRRTLYIDLHDCFKRLFALFNRIYRRSMNSTPKAHNANESGATTMKTKLILALTLSVLAANTFAADGYDRTGSAAFTTEAAVASDGYDHTGSASFASDGSDHTGAAKVAADGADHVGAGRLS